MDVVKKLNPNEGYSVPAFVDVLQTVFRENGVHGKTVTEKRFAGVEYFSKYMQYTGCDRCVDKDELELAGALFTSKGFSTDGDGFMFEIRINIRVNYAGC